MKQFVATLDMIEQGNFDEAQLERFEACLERPQPSLASALLSLLLSSSIKQLKLSTPLHYILFVLYTSRTSQS